MKSTMLKLHQITLFTALFIYLSNDTKLIGQKRQVNGVTNILEIYLVLHWMSVFIAENMIVVFFLALLNTAIQKNSKKHTPLSCNIKVGCWES